MLQANGNIRLIDFGNSVHGNPQICHRQVGTPLYASPLMHNKEPYNPFALDIWSAGVILYEMFVGYLLFRELEEYTPNFVFNVEARLKRQLDAKLLDQSTVDLLKLLLVVDDRQRLTNWRNIRKCSFFAD